MLSALLGPDGCEVEACVSLADARHLPSSFMVGALVLDIDQAEGDALLLIQELRMAGHMSEAAPVIALTDRRDAAVRQRIEAAGALQMLKPASLLDLAEVVRQALPSASDERSFSRPAHSPAHSPQPTSVPDRAEDTDEPPMYFLPGPEPGPPEPVAPPPSRSAPAAAVPAPEVRNSVRAESRPRRAWHMGNARALTRWWARKGTGVLRVEGATSAWVLIARGGPVGPDGVAAVEEALSGGEVALDPCDVEEVGDRAALARLVWRAAREAVATENVLQLTPVANGLTEAAAELPLTAASRRCLARLGGVNVQDLARREGAPTADVAVDLAALRWLGLIALRDGSAGELEGVGDTPSQMTASVVRPPAVLQLAGDSGSRAEAERAGDPPSHIERPFAAGRHAEPRRRSESAGDPPTAPEGAPVERIDDPATHATASMMPIGRLRREVEILRTADSWTVLGIPRRSPPEMIQGSAQRMKHRYLVMDKDPNPEARELAAEIVRRIEAAETELLTGKASQAEPVFDGVMRQGVAAVAAREWARADRCFTQARQQSPDSALAVAHLGWARFNNPEQAREPREEDGADLVELALQFDINCAIAWNFRGEIATARGEVDEARQCFSTALKLDPTMMIARRR